MRTVWIISHAHNPGLFYARSDYPQLWTRDEREALQFDTQDAADNHIVSGLNGQGRAVKASFYVFEGDRLAA
jgi:hypothetical protein